MVVESLQPYLSNIYKLLLDHALHPSRRYGLPRDGSSQGALQLTRELPTSSITHAATGSRRPRHPRVGRTSPPQLKGLFALLIIPYSTVRYRTALYRTGLYCTIGVRYRNVPVQYRKDVRCGSLQYNDNASIVNIWAYHPSVYYRAGSLY